jgi:alkyl hydroperoxide reductase subunit AhpC
LYAQINNAEKIIQKPLQSIHYKQNKQKMKYIVFLILLAGITFSACKSEKTFRIEGTITSSDGETMFLEHRGLANVTVLDSVVLKSSGTFRMRGTMPENPEFYQLRIGNQVGVFSVFDEDRLTVKADAKDFARSFTVENSPTNDQLRQVDGLREQASQRIADLERQHTAQQIDDMSFIEQIDNVLTDYKTEASKIILANPASAAAYYALFQRINDYMIFDPYTRQDYPMFGAVATSWNLQYPGTLRTKHLHDFTMLALTTRRQAERQATMLENIDIEIDGSLPDIVLPDVAGNRIALSSLQGKVVVLDFTVYNADFSPTHNMDLNRIYERFRSRGVEIYQIAFDSDQHFWKNAADNLPWITVRDPQSVNSRLFSTYNVRELPTVFIINREGDIVARAVTHEEIERELNRVL